MFKNTIRKHKIGENILKLRLMSFLEAKKLDTAIIDVIFYKKNILV